MRLKVAPITKYVLHHLCFKKERKRHRKSRQTFYGVVYVSSQFLKALTFSIDIYTILIFANFVFSANKGEKGANNTSPIEKQKNKRITWLSLFMAMKIQKGSSSDG